VASFTSFVTMLTETEDLRPAGGKLYWPPHGVLFVVLSIVTGANPNGRSTASSMSISAVVGRALRTKFRPPSRPERN
jgi:hypothetical protein